MVKDPNTIGKIGRPAISTGIDLAKRLSAGIFLFFGLGFEPSSVRQKKIHSSSMLLNFS